MGVELEWWDEAVQVPQSVGGAVVMTRKRLAEVAAASVLARADFSQTAGQIAERIVGEIIDGMVVSDVAQDR